MDNYGGKLAFAAGLDNSQMRMDAEEARSLLRGIGTTATQEGNMIDSSMKKIGAAITGIFAISQVKAFVSQLSTVRGEFQQMEMAFKTMLGSADKADALMSQLIKTAATTPFGMNDVAQGAKQLLAYGVEADKVNDTLIRLGDIAAGLSIPLNDLTYLYGTTMVQGRMYTQDLNQFLGRGIPLTEELARQFGVTKDKVKGLVEEGKVGFPQVEQAIINMTNQGSRFGGLMAAQSATITGQLSNLKDGFEQMFNEIGKSTEGMISDSIGMVSAIVENWRSVGEAVTAVIATYGAYKAAVIATAAVQNAAKTVRHTEEAAQLYEVMTAEQKARISKMNLATSSEAYYMAVRSEVQAEMERQTQLAASTNMELKAARERLAMSETTKAAAAQTVAAKRAELESTIQEANTEQVASLKKKMSVESEAQSRAALRVVKLQEQKDALITQAQALKESNASDEVVATKNREIAAISQRIAAARAEEIQRGQNVIAIRKEMAATVDATTSKKIAKATTALETAEENMNTASKARNAAAREVSSKAALLDSAVRRANTIETAANTAAETANATATGALSVAKARLAAVASRLNAVIMANPWAIALAAVVALGYGIYKLITYQTDAEKAQKRLDEATNDYSKSVASEQIQIDSLFARLKAAKEGTQEYESAKESIIRQYGSYLNGLGEEVKSLRNVEKAYNAVSESAIKAAKARAMDKFRSDAADTFGQVQADTQEELYQLLKKRYGNQKGKDGMSLAEVYFAQLKEVIGGNKQLNEEWASQFNKTHYVQGSIYSNAGSYTYTTNEVKDLLEKIEKARSVYDESMKEAQRRFGDSMPTASGNNGTPVEIRKDKEYWENYRKEQQGLLDAMTEAELKTQKAAEIKRNIQEAQNHIDGYNVKGTAKKDGTETDRIEEQTAERNRAIRSYGDSVIRQTEQTELDIRQREIELKEDGYEKQKAQIDLNYDRLIAENKKRERDMLEALADNKVNEWENAHPEATKTQSMEYRASLNLTYKDLSPKQQEQLRAYQRLADESRVRGNKEALNTMLQDVLTYEQQRQKIAEEYEEKRKALYEKDDNGNVVMGEDGRPKLRQGVTQGNIDELNRNEEESLNGIDEQFAQREETYKAWCNEISNLTLERLKSILEQTEEELKKVEQSGTRDPQKLATARAKVNTAKTNVAKAQAKENLNPDKRSIKEWQDLYKTLSDCNKEFENIGDTVGGVVGEIIKQAGQMATSTLSMINGIVQLANMSSTSVKATATTASAAIQTVEKASVILTIISAALQIATQIASMFNDDEAKQEEIEHLQDRIDQLQWELDHADIVRVQERNGKALDLVKQKLAETREELAKDAVSVGAFTSMFESLYMKVSDNDELLKQSAEKIATAYANVAYTADKALGNVKYDNAREQLENIAKQQLLIQEQIDTEKSKKDSDSSQIADWEQKIEELGAKAISIINEMVEDIMGGTSSDIAKELSDAFFEAFENGEDAAETWHDKVNELIADIMKRMLTQKFLEEPLGEIFDKYKAVWFKDGKFAGIDSVLNSIAGLTTDLNGTFDSFTAVYDIIKQLPEDLQEKFMEDASREASTKGIAQASQDSVDELNGRATAIQGHTYSINENTKLLVATSQLILQSVLNIESNTDGLSERMATVEDNVKRIKDTVNDIALKGIKLKN